MRKDYDMLQRLVGVKSVDEQITEETVAEVPVSTENAANRGDV